MPTAILVDDGLALAAAERAGLTGRSLVKFVEDAIAWELVGWTTADPAIAGPIATFGGDGVVDGLTLIQAAAQADAKADARVAEAHLLPDAGG